MNKEKWHGWIVIETAAGYRDHFYAEYVDEQGNRQRVDCGWSPCAAIEWWDKRVGKPVTLLQTPLGALRVYTMEPEPIPETPKP